MKQVAGLPKSSGTSTTCKALSRSQPRKSGVTASEQTKTKAVSILFSVRAALPTGIGPYLMQCNIHASNRRIMMDNFDAALR